MAKELMDWQKFKVKLRQVTGEPAFKMKVLSFYKQEKRDPTRSGMEPIDQDQKYEMNKMLARAFSMTYINALLFYVMWYEMSLCLNVYTYWA